MRIFVSFLAFLFFSASCTAADNTRYFHYDEIGGPKKSAQSGLAGDGIRMVTSIPGVKGDDFLRRMKAFVDSESRWDVPDGYGLSIVPFKNFKAELLHKNGTHSKKAVLLLHGGAYLIQLSNIYRTMAVRYSKMTDNADVLMPDYRIAPKYVFPSALEDAFEAWNWLLAKGYKPEDILVAGDSAGGNLTLALTLKLRDMGKELPGAIICMSPWTDMAGSGKSHVENMTVDPLFGNTPEYLPPKDGVMPEVLPFILSYVGRTDLKNPYLSPAYAKYDRFPPMLIQVGTEEVLESDAELVYQRAVKAQVDATLTRYYGMFHVFQILGEITPESREAWNEVNSFIAMKFLHEKQEVLQKLPVSTFVIRSSNESVRIVNEPSVGFQ